MVLQLQENCKILIIKPSSLGDIVHSLPFLHAIKKRYPKSEVHWVIAKGLFPFLEEHPLIDRFWLFNKDQWKCFSNLKKTVPELRFFIQGLRSQHFDVSIDLSGLLRSGLITWVAGAKHKLGFAESDEGSPLFYTHKIHGDMNIHAIDRYLKIATFMGCEANEIHYPLPPYDSNPAVCADLPEKYCVMVPSAGKEANRWPAERFGQLAAKFSMPSVLIGGRGDEPVAETVVENANGKAISLAGRTTLKELIPIIKKAEFMVSNDTGPMHIAAACNVPVFAIFGPANPGRTGPYGEIHTIIREELDCAPCYAWKPCDNWRCMENIEVNEVFDRIREKKLIGENKVCRKNFGARET